MSTTRNAPVTFSSAHMRERDKIIREKHDRELSTLHNKINRLGYTNDDLRKQIYDVEERATRLSNALGFEDFIEAQVFISTADQDVSYKDCFDQLGALKAELDAANFDVASLQEQLALADQERAELKAKLATSRKLEQEAPLKQEIAELRQQYDVLLNKYNRATDFYKADYKKWRKFNAWLFSECGDEKSMNGEDIRVTASVLRKKRKLQEMLEGVELSNDEDCPPPLGGLRNPYLEDDESQTTLRPARDLKPGLFPVSPIVLAPSSTRINTPASIPPNTTSIPKPFANSKKVNKKPLHSPSVFLDLAAMDTESVTARGSMVYKPVPDVLRMRQLEPLPSRTGTIKQNRKASLDEVLILSSETERDPQVLPRPAKTLGVLPFLPRSSDTEDQLSSPLKHRDVPLPTASPPPSPAVKAPTTADSSDTEPDTQWTSLSTQHHAPLPARSPPFRIPEVPQLADSSDTEQDIHQTSSPHQQQNVLLPTPKSLARPAPLFRLGKRDATDDSRTCPMEPPRKKIRVDVTQTPKDSHPSQRSKISPRSARKKVTGNSESRRLASHSSTRKENKENAMLVAAPTQASSTKVVNTSPQDYSAFKGRGRYAKGACSTKTINALYAIDSSRNGGVEHPYDEVVRRKEDRRKMDAGDCECCRDYYEAIGPLPSPMQPPLWRSPEAKKKKTGNASRGTSQHKRHVSDSNTLLPPSASKTSSFLNDSQDSLFSQFESSKNKRYSGIEDHKKLISRHRHHWARAVTPPGYWNIGFPSTQEAETINEKAKEMHRKKQVEVDRLIRTGEGKYRRR